MRPRFFEPAAALLACLWAISALAQLPATQLTTIFPPGIQQGASAEVTISGADLDDVTHLVFSHPGLAATPKTSSATALVPERPIPNQFLVTASKETPPGIYEVRAAGRFGLSNPRLFVVGPYIEQRDPGGNTTPEKALDLPLGTTLSGHIDPSTYEYIKIKLQKGQSVLLAIAARRIDSKLDATLVVEGPSGRELARVKEGALSDPVTLFTAPETGDYLLKLSDAVYGGGNDYFYRLTASAAPFIDFIFPPSGLPGSTATYTLYGQNLPGGKPAGDLTRGGVTLEKIETTITLPADDARRTGLAQSASAPLARAWQDAIEFRLPSPTGPSNPVSVCFAAVDSLLIEHEPNNDHHTAQQLQLPCEVAGQFYPERDFDWYEFTAKKGQTYWIEVVSHQLGLASDPALILYRVQGDQQTEVAQADDLPDRARRNPATAQFDATSDDPAYKFVVPADGTYRLLVRDQFGDSRRDPAFVYRLILREPQPDFRALAYIQSPPPTQQQQNQTPLAAASLRQGGTLPIEIAIQRRDDFPGEIAIHVEGLPSGVTSPGAILGGTVTEGTLVLVAAENAPAWSGPIQIVATANIDGRPVTRQARSAVVAWGSPNRTQQPAEFRLAQDLRLAVIDKESDPALIQVGDGQIVETSLGANVDLPIKLARRGDFKDPIKLSAVGLTQQMRPKDVTLAGDAKEAKFELALNQQNIRPGSYTFYLKGESKHRYVRNPAAIAAAAAEQQRLAALLASINAEIKSAAAAKNDEAAKAAQENLKAATTLKTQCDKHLEDAKKANQPKEIPIALVSTPIQLRIHHSPIQLTLDDSTINLQSGQKQELTLKINRLYGFADEVELTLDPPSSLPGFSAPKITLKKDQSVAKLELTAPEKLPPGQHQTTLHARARFNNVQVETTAPVTIQIQPK